MLLKFPKTAATHAMARSRTGRYDPRGLQDWTVISYEFKTDSVRFEVPFRNISYFLSLRQTPFCDVITGSDQSATSESSRPVGNSSMLSN